MNAEHDWLRFWLLLVLVVTVAFILGAAIRAGLDSLTRVPEASAESPTVWAPIADDVLRPLPAVASELTPSPQPTTSPPLVVSTPVPKPRGPGIRVALTWYCLAGRSRCTKGYPDTVGQQLYAAASPDLLALGWRNRVVRILYGGVDVYVRIVDCDCQAYRSLDLYSDAFRALAPLGMGRITATAVLLR